VSGRLEKRLHELGAGANASGAAVESRGASLRKAQDISAESRHLMSALRHWLRPARDAGRDRSPSLRLAGSFSKAERATPTPDYRGKSGRFPKYDWPRILEEVETLYSKEPWPESYSATARHIVTWLEELRVEPPDEDYLRLRISQHMHERQQLAVVGAQRQTDPLPVKSHQPSATRTFRRVIELSITLAVVLLAGVAGYSLGTRDVHRLHVIQEIVAYFVVYAEDPERIVEVGGDDRIQIESWFSRRTGTQVRVPDLGRFGLSFRGARLMAVGTLPTPMLLYETADRRFVGLCMANVKSEHPNGVDSKRAPNFTAYYWSHRGVLFVLMGSIDADFLRAIAHDVDSQIASTDTL
jgi:anti-sigma factor RsiW